MKRRLLILICLLVAFATIPGGHAEAQSLFERSGTRNLNPFMSVVARERGDLLVVLINENTDVENIDERSLDRLNSSTLNGGLNYSLTGNLGTQIGTSSLGQTGNATRNFSGDSEFRSERQFQDRFSVTVIDVLPNGNLMVEGRRKISLQGDGRTLQLTGIIRNIDIMANNTINSQLISSLEIRLLADGPEEEYGKQG
ncbi:MAG: flagellar basal body L-ring protein FlgH, partial [Planctomycetota bacterium]